MKYYIINRKVKDYALKASHYCVLCNVFGCNHINDNRPYINLILARYIKRRMQRYQFSNEKFVILGVEK